MALEQVTDDGITIESNHESTEQIKLAFAETTGAVETPSDLIPAADARPAGPAPTRSADATPSEADVESADPPTRGSGALESASEETVVDPVDSAADPAKPPERLRKKSSTVAVQSAIAKQREAEHRAQIAEAKLAQLAQAPMASPSDTATTPAKAKADWARYKAMPSAPKVADFEDYEDYSIALTTFVSDVRHHERSLMTEHENQQRALADAQDARSKLWQTRLTEARTKDPNFDATLDPNTPMSLPMQHLAMESPVGVALLQYLSTHQEDSQRLSTLHPVDVYREMGKLEERLSADTSSSSGSVRVGVSHAKPPIKPLGTSPHTPDANEVTDDMPFEEHFRRMNAADRKRGLL
jgi:hypothetical protein